MNVQRKVYQSGVISTLLYGSEAWTAYARQEKKLNAFHMRCLKRTLGLTLTRLPTSMFSAGQNNTPSLQCSAYDAYGGLNMYGAWRNVAYQRICCTVNLNLENVSKYALILNTKMYNGPLISKHSSRTLILEACCLHERRQTSDVASVHVNVLRQLQLI